MRDAAAGRRRHAAPVGVVHAGNEIRHRRRWHVFVYDAAVCSALISGGRSLSSTSMVVVVVVVVVSHLKYYEVEEKVVGGPFAAGIRQFNYTVPTSKQHHHQSLDGFSVLSSAAVPTAFSFYVFGSLIVTDSVRMSMDRFLQISIPDTLLVILF